MLWGQRSVCGAGARVAQPAAEGAHGSVTRRRRPPTAVRRAADEVKLESGPDHLVEAQMLLEFSRVARLSGPQK